MEPVPTSFHVGPFEFHTYGLGLAIAAYVAFLYGERRFAARGLDRSKFGRFTVWLLVLGLVGARVAHVATNWSTYSGDLLRVFAVWQGGLASFGALAVTVPAGYVLIRRYWPSVRPLAVVDALIPVLIAGWALGRILGPQFMVAGGGHVTNQWFGLSYAGQVGKRVPVPIIQSLEDGTLWAVLVTLERRTHQRLAVGTIAGLGCIVWGICRFVDEALLLGQGSNAGSIAVEASSLLLVAIGVTVVIVARRTRARDADSVGASMTPSEASAPPSSAHH